ncbi:MAG TPA: ABC transporter permease [Bryobacteraceae bacterium]|nr:ABC transporter permease [Bryobacteraceae bacterium]
MSLRALDHLRQDTQYAIRATRKDAIFALTTILTLALAIGGNTAMFTVIRAVLLKPLNYSDADKLVRVPGGSTPTRFEEMRAAQHSFTDIGAYTGPESFTLLGGAEPEVLAGTRVTAGFLRILEAAPVLGREFLPGEDSAGGPPVVMISDQLWRRKFLGDPRIVGKTLTLADAPYTVIGVLPPEFNFPFFGLDLWMTQPSEWPEIPPKARMLSPYLTLFGRLKPGVDLNQASAEASVLRHRYALAHPTMLDARPNLPNRVVPLKDALVTDVRSMLWMLFGAVSFVLLIACANVAGLLLARATSRLREFALRAALGADRGRLLKQLLAESLLLSIAGGALGLLLANWAVQALPHVTALRLPRAHDVHIDGTVLAFAVGLSVVSGLLFGLAPSLGASRPDLITVLRVSGQASEGAGLRHGMAFSARGLLIVGQAALSIVLLIGAALLTKSVAHLRGVDPGFNPSDLLTFRISLPQARYDTNQKRMAFHDEMMRRLETTPGIASAAAGWYLPLMGAAGTPVQDATQPRLKLNERPIATLFTVMPGYFGTLEIPMKRGRDFTARDNLDGSNRVTIIDETLARQFWPAYPGGPDPVGQHLLIGGVDPRPAEVIGIAADVRSNLEGNTWPGAVYAPFGQSAQGAPQSIVIAVRTKGDPIRFANTVRQEVRAVDRDQPIEDIRTMEERVEAQVGQRRSMMMLLELFAGVALLLALMGLYGVIAYSVAQRTKEVAIRRALGAQQGDIMRLVVGQGLGFALAGVAVGLGAAIALTRVMKSVLFQVSATDPVIFSGVAALFVIVALAASYIPARRASRIDPMAALRI